MSESVIERIWHKIRMVSARTRERHQTTSRDSSWLEQEEEKCVDELTNDLADTLDIDREVFDDLRPPSKERDTDGSKHTK